MAINYDPVLIQEFAGKLYKKAGGIIASYTVMGLIIGGIAGLLSEIPAVALIGAIVGALVGYSIGSEKAFEYKLQAQNALCQVQIEVNTRK